MKKQDLNEFSRTTKLAVCLFRQVIIQCCSLFGYQEKKTPYLVFRKKKFLSKLTHVLFRDFGISCNNKKLLSAKREANRQNLKVFKTCPYHVFSNKMLTNFQKLVQTFLAKCFQNKLSFISILALTQTKILFVSASSNIMKFGNIWEIKQVVPA